MFDNTAGYYIKLRLVITLMISLNPITYVCRISCASQPTMQDNKQKALVICPTKLHIYIYIKYVCIYIYAIYSQHINNM